MAAEGSTLPPSPFTCAGVPGTESLTQQYSLVLVEEPLPSSILSAEEGPAPGLAGANPRACTASWEGGGRGYVGEGCIGEAGPGPPCMLQAAKGVQLRCSGLRRVRICTAHTIKQPHGRYAALNLLCVGPFPSSSLCAGVEGRVDRRYDLSVAAPSGRSGAGAVALTDPRYAALNRKRTHSAANRSRGIVVVSEKDARRLTTSNADALYIKGQSVGASPDLGR